MARKNSTSASSCAALLDPADDARMRAQYEADQKDLEPEPFEEPSSPEPAPRPAPDSGPVKEPPVKKETSIVEDTVRRCHPALARELDRLDKSWVDDEWLPPRNVPANEPEEVGSRRLLPISPLLPLKELLD